MASPSASLLLPASAAVPPPQAQQALPQIPRSILGSSDPFVVTLAFSKYDASSAYGRGPRSLVYTQRKRLVIALAGLLALTACIVLSTVCLYHGFCIAANVGTRMTYSYSASEAVVPVCLVLIFVLAPLSCVAAHLQRPGLVAISAGCQALAFILLLASTIGSFVVMGGATSRADTLWPTLSPTMRASAYGGSVSNLSAEILDDARSIALSSLAGAILTFLLAFLHTTTLRRYVVAWRAAIASAAAEHAAASNGQLAGGLPLPVNSMHRSPLQLAVTAYGWWKPVPDLHIDDTDYPQLLTRGRWVACCSKRPTAAVNLPDCCGICSLPAIESCSSLFPCCCRPGPPPVPMPYPYPRAAASNTGAAPAAPAPPIAPVGNVVEAATNGGAAILSQPQPQADQLLPQQQQQQSLLQPQENVAPPPSLVAEGLPPQPSPTDGLPDPQQAMSPQAQGAPGLPDQQVLAPAPQAPQNDLLSMLSSQAQPLPQF